MTTLVATYTRIARRPQISRRHSRPVTDQVFVTPAAYIPSGTADMWRASRPRFSR